MRAVLCKEWGGPEKLTVEEIPAPPLREGAVRVAVHAAGVNFADLLLIAGQYQEKPAFSFIPGGEVAGVVSEVGPGVHELKAGDRVMALTGLARVCGRGRGGCRPRLPHSRPHGLCRGRRFSGGLWHFAWGPRMARAIAGRRVAAGPGAAGGVGLSAVEIGKAMGARVIACASGPEKLAIAQQHGADHLIDYSREDIRGRVKAITEGHGWTSSTIR